MCVRVRLRTCAYIYERECVCVTGVLRVHPVEIIAQTRIARALRDYLD